MMNRKIALTPVDSRRFAGLIGILFKFTVKTFDYRKSEQEILSIINTAVQRPKYKHTTAGETTLYNTHGGKRT